MPRGHRQILTDLQSVVTDPLFAMQKVELTNRLGFNNLMAPEGAPIYRRQSGHQQPNNPSTVATPDSQS